MDMNGKKYANIGKSALFMSEFVKFVPEIQLRKSYFASIPPYISTFLPYVTSRTFYGIFIIIIE